MERITGARSSGGGVALRLFAAVRVPSEQARELAERAELLAEHASGARALTSDQLHLTFAYLGDVAEEHVPAVATALEAAARSITGPTSVTLGEPTQLGDGTALAFEASLDLHVLVDTARDRFIDAVVPYALDVERRPWHPHVTILRTRTNTSMQRVLDTLADGAPARSWVASELQLIASLPGPSGRLHKVLHSVPLGSPVPRQ